jgi:hypothetical protein
MRLSTIESRFLKADDKQYAVYLDGVYRPQCVTLDTDVGQIVEAMTDKNGEVVIKDNAIQHQTLYGIVTFEEIKKPGFFKGILGSIRRYRLKRAFAKKWY